MSRAAPLLLIAALLASSCGGSAVRDVTTSSPETSARPAVDSTVDAPVVDQATGLLEVDETLAPLLSALYVWTSDLDATEPQPGDSPDAFPSALRKLESRLNELDVPDLGADLHARWQDVISEFAEATEALGDRVADGSATQDDFEAFVERTADIPREISQVRTIQSRMASTLFATRTDPASTYMAQSVLIQNEVADEMEVLWFNLQWAVPEDPQAAVATISESSDRLRTALDRWTALTPPDELSDQHDFQIDTIRTTIQTYDRLIAAIGTKSQPAPLVALLLDDPELVTPLAATDTDWQTARSEWANLVADTLAPP